MKLAIAAGVLLLVAACGASGGAPTTPVGQPVRVMPAGQAAPAKAGAQPAQSQPAAGQHATAPPAGGARPSPASGGDGTGPAVGQGMQHCPVGSNPPLHRLCPVGGSNGGPAAP
jgi:hypothetical protein